MPFSAKKCLRLLAVLSLLLMYGCAGSKFTEEGKASYYSNKLAGRKMANGEKYNPKKLTAAHKTLPFGTRVKVTNLETRKTVKVKIPDRGPFSPNRIQTFLTVPPINLTLLRPVWLR